LKKGGKDHLAAKKSYKKESMTTPLRGRRGKEVVWSRPTTANIILIH